MSSKKKGGKGSSCDLEKVFSQYADDEDPQIIDVVGIGNICEEVGIDAEDISALMLIWTLGAKAQKPQCITKEEFIQGFFRRRFRDQRHDDHRCSRNEDHESNRHHT